MNPKNYLFQPKMAPNALCPLWPDMTCLLSFLLSEKELENQNKGPCPNKLFSVLPTKCALHYSI